MITDAVSSGVFYLKKQQQTDGSFLSLSSPSPTYFKKALTFHSTFSTALILSCLNSLKETAILKTIKQKAASFLLTQKSEYWSFNYWVRGSKEAREMPYPDDLDDTFCALSAIYQYNPRLINGVSMAKIVTLLTATEDKEGGPYRTWFVQKKAGKKWRDIDLAVNSNIAYFLFLQEIDLPNLALFIESRINQGNLISPYYPTIYPIICFLSRWYKGKGIKKIESILLSKQNKDGYWENPLCTALAVSSLLHLGIPPINLRKSISYLLSCQTKGSWEPYGFCLDPGREGKTYYAGCPALTTAFCLEAIGKYLRALETHPTEITKKIDSESKRIHDEIITKVQKRFSHLTSELEGQAEVMLKIILKMNDKNQITLLPYFFRSALRKNAMLSDKLLISLGSANTYGWIAYTIYDNFLDEEGDPKTLSIANIVLRELTIIFHKVLPENMGFQKLFCRILDELDAANAWEVTHCRMRITNARIDLENTIPQFGNYEKLAQKSLGHALGPLAMLFSLGYQKKSLEVKSLLDFFIHYLVSRQLNDDAHDWEKDLKKGHINPVLAILLRTYKMKNKKSKNRILVLELIPKLRELFWYEVIVSVCELILKHVALARTSLNQLSIMENQVLFRELLNSIEQSANQALNEREKILAFSKNYKTSPF